MTQFDDLHPILQRQLRRSGITSLDGLPELEAWQTAIEKISVVYEEAARAESLDERALALASAEMQGLYENLKRHVADLRQYRQLVHSSEDAIYMLDLDGTVRTWNPASEAMTGYTEADVLGRPLISFVAPEFVEQMNAWIAAAAEGQPVSYTQHRQRKDGTPFIVSARMEPIRDPDGTVTGVFVVGRDVTDVAAAQEQRAQAATIVSSSQDGIAAIGLDRTIALWNPALEQIYGYTAAETVGQPFSMIIPPEFADQIESSLDSAIAGQTVTYVQPQRRKDGSPFTISARLTPIRDTGGHTTGVYASKRDVTEQEQAKAAARQSQAQLRAIIDNTSAAISVRDLGFRFLMTNPAFRALTGQPADAQLAGCPDSEVLPAGAIPRQRVGDHRVLAGETITGEQTVIVGGAERVMLSQRFPLADAAGQVYAIAEVSAEITEAKRAERELRERIGWEEHISRAIREGRLLVYAQPIIDLATGELWGEELLVRMTGGRGPADVVEPAEFLPQAERFGLMPVIDQFMLAAAVKLAAAGRRISVNISASSIQTPALAEQITLALAAAPEAAPNLTFEITETAALASPGVAQAFSDRLAELGAGLALDDFGTGYGGLTELRDLNLHSLKIDLSFVRNLADSADNQRIVKLIIHIAREYGITTTAEGVEDPRALALLREYGAARAQGYLIGRPAPVQP